jgi:hypothetical protein
MNISNPIFVPSNIEKVRNIINEGPELSRYKLSQEICRHFNWRSSNGSLKEMSCRKTLLQLHRAGVITLPKVREKPPKGFKGDGNFDQAFDLPLIQEDLNKLGNIELILIECGDREKSRIWNTLMSGHHYLGAGPLCGAQIRYLIHSEYYGFLGGFAFSAAAWHLEGRDLWIGWNVSARQKNLDKVVSNSRFLILPTVNVANLASHVLSLVVKRLPADWQERYGIEPVLLETFVDPSRFKGTCYRAANWKHVGTTKGRGRQDTNNEFAVLIKDIYLYPLRMDAIEILCDGLAKPVFEPKEPDDWAEEEFGTAELGDQRRLNRLLNIARDFYARPQANIPQACQSRAKTKAAYRFLEDTNNTMDKILAPHYETTLSRVNKEKVILAVQDTTTLNYSTHPATQDLGLIASRHEGIIGLIVHDTMTFNLDGKPLGLLDVQSWARNPEDFGKKHFRHQLPIEQKESNKWLKSFKATAKAQKRCPETILVSVGDREADIYELFQLALSYSKGPKLLVRAERHRLLADGQGHLWDYIARGPLCGIQEVDVPRKGKKKARKAQLEVRFARVILKPPKRKPELGELGIWAILAEEVDTPDGVVPLKWMLLTTFAVNSFGEAVEKLGWYCIRWGIEIYHRTLKSGCKIESRQLGSADRIEACLAIDMVIAWRIYHLTKLGRQTPDVPCTMFFEDAEWKALVAFKTQNPIPPDKPPTLREATHMVASLGGFLGRKCDGEPGTTTLWLGLQRLDDITTTWKVFMRFLTPDHLSPPVSSVPNVGKDEPY